MGASSDGGEDDDEARAFEESIRGTRPLRGARRAQGGEPAARPAGAKPRRDPPPFDEPAIGAPEQALEANGN